jgi:hypothetical protein
VSRSHWDNCAHPCGIHGKSYRLLHYFYTPFPVFPSSAVCFAIKHRGLGSTLHPTKNKHKYSILNRLLYVTYYISHIHIKISELKEWIRNSEPGRPLARYCYVTSCNTFNRSGNRKNFHFFMLSILILEPTQPPIQRVLLRCLVVKRPGRESDHSTSTSDEIKKVWIYTSTVPYACLAYCLVN